FGVDDMGNSAVGRLNAAVIGSGSATAAMSTGGEDRHTPAESEGPVITPTAHLTNPNYFKSGDQNVAIPDSPAVVSVNRGGGTNATTGGSVTIDPIGGGAAHNNMPPFMLGTWYIFLG